MTFMRDGMGISMQYNNIQQTKNGNLRKIMMVVIHTTVTKKMNVERQNESEGGHHKNILPEIL